MEGGSSKREPSGAVLLSRRTDIFQKAARLFLDHGYRGVSINMIISALGGSKRDLYRMIGGKEALFRDTIIELCRSRSDLISGIAASDDPQADLQSLGRQFLAMLLDEDTLKLHRLVVAEGTNFPAIAAEFYHHGPAAAYAAASAMLEHHRAAGRLSFEDSGIIARLFLDSLTGDLQLRSLAGLMVTPEEVSSHVRAGCDIMFRACKTS